MSGFSRNENKGRTIVHVDMDAFYAAVEMRDNKELRGKPLIIGALPSERGVVSTCSYEAREFGVRSAMSIKDAYRLCPHGIYMHPDLKKYKSVSQKIHEIWCDYTDIIEYLSLDEGYLDITDSAHIFGGALKVAALIKKRTLDELNLTCSVGIGYSMMSAKLASEEKKPNGLFEIPNPEFLQSLIIDRNVRVLYGVGAKTAEKLKPHGIITVRNILENPRLVKSVLGSQGDLLVNLALGIDEREIVPYYESETKSISRELTFQEDIADIKYLKSVLRLLAKELSLKAQASGLYGRTINLKLTYGDMKTLTRSKSGEPTNEASKIYAVTSQMLDKLDISEKRPVRLVGAGISGLSEDADIQLSFDDLKNLDANKKKSELNQSFLNLQNKYGASIIKTGAELEAEKIVSEKEEGE